MSGVHILTNSVSDISPAFARELGVTLIPDTIAFGPGRQYLNNVDIGPPALYRELANAPKLPTTAHPNIAQFTEAFTAAAPGASELLCISLTSKMSGSCNTAGTAKKLLQEQGFALPITVYDSLQVSFGQAVLVSEAAQMAKQGATAAEIVARLDELREHVGVYFVMPSLANARKGGRVGAIRVLAADLLKVKPILMFRDGLVRDVGIVRGMDAGIDRVVEHYRTGARYGQEVFLFHADREEKAKEVAARIQAIDPAAHIRIEWVGAVIGIYTGAGCIGVAFREI